MPKFKRMVTKIFSFAMVLSMLSAYAPARTVFAEEPAEAPEEPVVQLAEGEPETQPDAVTEAGTEEAAEEENLAEVPGDPELSEPETEAEPEEEIPAAEAPEAEENLEDLLREAVNTREAGDLSTGVWVDGTAGDDDTADGTEEKPFKTFAKALAQMPEDGIIHVKGDFDGGVSFVMDKKGTIVIEDDVTMTGSGTQTAVQLKAQNSAITVKDGKTLTVSNYKHGIIAGKATEIRDGKYNFILNQGYAFQLTQAKVQGSAPGMVEMVITDGMFYSNGPSSEINNAVVDQRFLGDKWQLYEWGGFKALNSTIKTTRFPMYFKSPFVLNNSKLIVDAGGARYQTGFYMDNAWELGDYHLTNNSVLEVKNFTEHWRAKGITLGYGAKMIVDGGSKVITINNTNGGLNVNDGHVVFDNGILETSGHTGAEFGVQKGGITFRGNSIVNTPGTSDKDNGIFQSGSYYYVTGGSHRVKYRPGSVSGLGSSGTAIPTNGPDNGNEELYLFTLAKNYDVLNPINKNGAPYEYPVLYPSDDNLKHAWTPKAEVVFKLMNGTAKFADGTTADKTARTIRGYHLDDVTGNDMAAITAAPTASIPFIGWFYKDDTGAEQEFDPAAERTNVNPLIVYAKWQSDYTVTYHNNQAADELYSEMFTEATKPAAPKSYEEVIAAKPSFEVESGTFIKWTYDKAGNDEAVEPLRLDENNRQIDLYAQFSAKEYKVSFSANGGTFNAASIFKTNPTVFTITTDENGGEVATIEHVGHKKKFLEIIGSIDHNLVVPGGAVSKDGFNLYHNERWYATPTGGTSTNFKDSSFLGFPISGDNPEYTSDVVYYARWTPISPIKLNAKLNADLSSDGNTTNTAPLDVIDGQGYNFTGSLDVTTIKNEQIAEVETQFPGAAQNPETVEIKNLSSDFTAVFTLPSKMMFHTPLTKDNVVFSDAAKNVFTVSAVTQTGNKVTVTLSLNKQGITNFKELKEKVQSMSDVLEVTIPDVQTKAGETAADEELKVTGTLSGKMFATAKSAGGTIHNFDFKWTGAQDPAKKDSKETGAEVISLTVKVKKALENQLMGDILIGDDTGHTSAYKVDKGDVLDYTGVLNVEPIQNQIRILADGKDQSKISVKDIKSEFIAKLVFADKLEVPAVPEVEFTENDLFKAEPVSVSGQEVTVKMTLKKSYQQFADLFTDVTNVPAELKFTVKGIKVKDSAVHDEKLKATGTVEGTFTGSAAHENGTKEIYNFKWKAVQKPEGKDFFQDAADNDTIAYTVQVQLPAESPLKGDILIGGDTEHLAAYKADKGAVLDYTGQLDISTIQNQIKILAQGKDIATIRVEDIDSSFTTVMTFQNKLEVPAVPEVEFTENDLFMMEPVSVAGQKVTVRMTLKKRYQQFEELYNDVVGVPEKLLFTIKGIKIADTAVNDEKLKVVGAVNGLFKGKAISASGKTEFYNFAWKGVQDPDGKDFFQDAADNETIAYTVQVQLPIESTLKGDILIGEDTEHVSPHKTEAEAVLDYTGRLDVTPIQSQIRLLAEGKDASKISVKDIKSEFIAVLKFPAKLEIPAVPAVEFTENDLFKAEPVSVAGQEVTVKMTLKKDYTKFADLLADVTGVPAKLDYTVKGIQVSNSVANDEKLTVVGTVNGIFTGKAETESGQKRFYNFAWKGVQDPAGKDFFQAAADNDTIAYTVQVQNPLQSALPGDILIGDNTEHDAPHIVKRGDVLDYTGLLKVDSIQNQIRLLADGRDTSVIEVSGITSEFTTVLTVPANIEIPSSPAAELTANDLFEIKETSVSGQKITIKMALKKNYTKFDDMFADVTGAPSDLKVTVKGLKVKDSAAEDEKLTVTGIVDGFFKGTARVVPTGSTEFYNFKWSAVQIPEGKDYFQAAADNSTIAYTVLVKTPMEFALKGDILIGSNTEHSAPHNVKRGDVLDYTGLLKVDPIQNQIRLLADGKDITLIDVKDVKSEFTSVLTIPANIEIPSVPAVEFTANDLFEAGPASVSGNKITVRMKLKKDYSRFEDLYNDVIGVPVDLKVTVKGLKVKDAAADNEKLTVVGTVEGTFTGTATLAGNDQSFSFSWKATQIPEGKDYFQAAGDDDTIAYTVVVKKPASPVPYIVPNTGDGSNIFLFAGVLLVSLLAIVGLLASRKKNK